MVLPGKYVLRFARKEVSVRSIRVRALSRCYRFNCWNGYFDLAERHSFSSQSILEV